MKAGWYEKNGDPHDVLVVGEMATPEPGPGEVRVRLKVSGVNPSDVKSRRGRPLVAPRVVPHSDGAGTIDAVGEGVDPARRGERVWIWNGQWKRPLGTAAECIVVPARQAVPLAASVGFEAGACFGIPALTAIHGVNLADARPGRTILVTGAAAAVGHYATQVATLRGARVIGTASRERTEHALSAGADEVIDYKNEDVAQRIGELTGGKGVDAIVDMDLSGTAPLLPKGILAAHGKHVVYGSNVAADIPVSFLALLWGSLTIQAFLVYELRQEERAKAIADLDGMLARDELRHTIGARFPLERIADAHAAVEGGRISGNVVLEL